MKKAVIICIAAAVFISVITIALMPRRETPKPYIAKALSVKKGDVTRGKMIELCVYMYESLAQKNIEPKNTYGKNANESIAKAYSLGIINENDSALYSGDTALTREEAAVLLYKTAGKYDERIQMSDAQINKALNGCYDNVVLTEREPCAFLYMTGAVKSGTRFIPSKRLDETEAADWINKIYTVYKRDHGVTFTNGVRIECGETVGQLIEEMGEPTDIVDLINDGETYIYDKNGIYTLVYTDTAAVRGFFTAVGAKETTDAPFSGGAYYKPPSIKRKKQTELSKTAEQRLLFDMIDAYVRSGGAEGLTEHESLVSLARENSRSVAEEGFDMAIPEKRTTVRGESAEDMFIELLTAKPKKGALALKSKRCVYAGVGLWYGSGEPCATILIDESEKAEKTDKPKFKKQTTAQKPTDSGEEPILASPEAESTIGSGAPFVIRPQNPIGSFTAYVADSETGESVVHAKIFGDELVVDPSVLDSGTDYLVTISYGAQGSERFSETSCVRCGVPEQPTITSPRNGEVIDTSGINATWRSRYSDFTVTLFDEGGTLLGETRVVNEKELYIDGLADGLYTLKVTAHRRDTNVILSESESRFRVQEATIDIIRTERPMPKFADTGYSSVFGSTMVYSSREEAQRNMQTVSVPVWHLNSNGTKVGTMMSVTVNKALAADVKSIFEEIYNGAEQFPIKSLGGYAWRNTATGSRSQHSYGTCIDINPDENYCIYQSGSRTGSFWKPHENPYSIPENGDVVRAFKSHGWKWGGDWVTMKDYMHFTYLGG